jgi:mycothiol synthase
MYTLECIDGELSDEVACDVNAFENGLRAELDPLVPPVPVSFTKAYAKHWDDTRADDAYIVRAADGTVVGSAWMTASLIDNAHLCFTRLGVAAAHRRKGVATKLLGAFVEFAAKHDRTTLVLGADLHHPAGDGFAASLGATVGQWAHVNQLILSDLPEGLIEHWIATANSATGAVHEYELQWIPDSDCPEEWIDDLCVVSDVLINDAPMDGIPVGERHTTPEQVRTFVAQSRALGRDWWTLIARHRASGEPVGYTEMFFPHEDPTLGSQGATAVSAKHRGYALGRWLKATMLERVMRERPEIDHIRTFNADSNDPMLAINFAMGFKNLHAACRWVIERADAETWLEKRT